jgi:hypothetical protein
MTFCATLLRLNLSAPAEVFSSVGVDPESAACVAVGLFLSTLSMALRKVAFDVAIRP